MVLTLEVSPEVGGWLVEIKLHWACVFSVTAELKYLGLRGLKLVMFEFNQVRIYLQRACICPNPSVLIPGVCSVDFDRSQ